MAAPSLLVVIMNCAVHGPPPALPGMRSFGTAVKSSKLLGGVEKTVFECVSCCNEDSYFNFVRAPSHRPLANPSPHLICARMHTLIHSFH